MLCALRRLSNNSTHGLLDAALSFAACLGIYIFAPLSLFPDVAGGYDLILHNVLFLYTTSATQFFVAWTLWRNSEISPQLAVRTAANIRQKLFLDIIRSSVAGVLHLIPEISQGLFM